MPDNEPTILRPGDAQIRVVFRPALLAGQPPSIELHLDGIANPFDGIRLLRAAEDQLRNEAEHAVAQLLSQAAPSPILRAN